MYAPMFYSVSCPAPVTVLPLLMSFLDPTYEVVGLPTPIPEVLFWPFKRGDPSSEAEQKAQAFRIHIFRNWATGYYNYPLDSPDTPVISLIQAGTETVKPSTTTVEEDAQTDFIAAFCADSMPADDVVLNTRMLGVFDKTADSILKDDPNTGNSTRKGLKVNYLWCKNSVWSCVYAATFATGSFKSSNTNTRKIVALDDANHFVSELCDIVGIF